MTRSDQPISFARFLFAVVRTIFGIGKSEIEIDSAGGEGIRLPESHKPKLKTPVVPGESSPEETSKKVQTDDVTEEPHQDVLLADKIEKVFRELLARQKKEEEEELKKRKEEEKKIEETCAAPTSGNEEENRSMIINLNFSSEQLKQIMELVSNFISNKTLGQIEERKNELISAISEKRKSLECDGIQDHKLRKELGKVVDCTTDSEEGDKCGGNRKIGRGSGSSSSSCWSNNESASHTTTTTTTTNTTCSEASEYSDDPASSQRFYICEKTSHNKVILHRPVLIRDEDMGALYGYDSETTECSLVATELSEPEPCRVNSVVTSDAESCDVITDYDVTTTTDTSSVSAQAEPSKERPSTNQDAFPSYVDILSSTRKPSSGLDSLFGRRQALGGGQPMGLLSSSATRDEVLSLMNRSDDKKFNLKRKLNVLYTEHDGDEVKKPKGGHQRHHKDAKHARRRQCCDDVSSDDVSRKEKRKVRFRT